MGKKEEIFAVAREVFLMRGQPSADSLADGDGGRSDEHQEMARDVAIMYISCGSRIRMTEPSPMMVAPEMPLRSPR